MERRTTLSIDFSPSTTSTSRDVICPTHQLFKVLGERHLLTICHSFVSSFLCQSFNSLGKVDLPVFRLQTSVTALHRRVEHLSEQANADQSRAVSAKKKGQLSLATTYLKLRSQRRAEIDHTSKTLGNVEQSLQTLQRTKADAEVVKAYKLAKRCHEDGPQERIV